MPGTGIPTTAIGAFRTSRFSAAWRVDELATGKRSVRVNALNHQRVGRNVGVVDEPAFDKRRDVVCPVELDFLRADDTPTPFGLHPAHLGERRGPRVAHTVAMGNLEEAVRCHDRADLDRFEEDVVTGPRHPLGKDGCVRDDDLQLVVT